MARRKHYETSTIKQIRCAVERFEKLNDEPLKGSAKTVLSELEKTQNLLHRVKVSIPAQECLFLSNKIWGQIRKIEEGEKQNRSLLKSIFQGSLSEEEKEKIENLKKQLPDINSVTRARNYDDLTRYNLINYKNKLLEYEKLIIRSIKPAEERDNNRLQSSQKRKEKKRLSDIKKKEKEKQTKAMAAAHAGKTRQLAQTVRRNIEHQRKILSACPYCNKPLGDKPEADHIYPVAKGGLSTEKNMVFICSNCNSLKSDKTLRVFVKSNNFYWSSIEYNLELLEKDF